jgi:hypothetical protein
VAVAPQLLWGNSCGHDFDFHLVSWFDALNAWRHGVVYPHWTPSTNYGAGEPRFVFYSPLTWMMGAALGAVLPWTLVPVVLTFLLLAGTGLATRALAREALEDGAATLAGCVALFSGYALFTAYERSAFAELAGGFWIPLVMLFAMRGAGVAGRVSECAEGAPSERKEKTTGAKAQLDLHGPSARLKSCSDTYRGSGEVFPQPYEPPPPSGLRPDAFRWTSHSLTCGLDGSTALLALAIAGAWLSNPTVGVMACYLLAGLAVVQWVVARSWAQVVRAAAGAALGIGLVAVYLVPAAFEQRWVDIKQVMQDPGQTLENNWLFAVHADPTLAYHDEVLHTVSVIAVAMVALVLAGLVVCWLRGRLPGGRRWWIPLALIPVAVLLLQFSFSRPVWNLLPELRFLQFPWRWLVALEAPMAIFVVAAVWPRASTRSWRRVAVAAGFAALFVAMTAYAGRSLAQACDGEDAVAGMLSAYRAGAGLIGSFEYEPTGADISLIATGLPQACLVADPAAELGKPVADPDAPPAYNAAQNICEATFAAAADSRPEHLRIAAKSPHPGYLVLRLRTFPAWLVKVNGRTVDSLPFRKDGLMAVPVPQGAVALSVDWTTTTDVVVGRWLSALGVLALTGLCLFERRRSRARL